MLSAGVNSDLVTYLESMIVSGGFPPGAKLPSQRELCETFSLSKGSVGRALARLERKGLIVPRHGAGTFVRDRGAQEPRRKGASIGVLLEEFGDAETYCGYILRGVQSKAQELNCNLDVHFIAYTDFSGEWLREYAAGQDGIILLGVYDTTAKWLPSTRPCVGVNMYRTYGSASVIDLDPMAAAEIAVAYFRERGVHRVVCYSINPNGAMKEPGINNAFKFRASAMSVCWPGQCIIVECDADSSEYPEEWINDETGLLFVSGSRFESAARSYFERRGRNLTDDACVLTLDGKTLCVPHYLPVDTIGTDYFGMGETAVEECLRRIDHPGQGARRIFQNVFLSTMAEQLRGKRGDA